jgi:hypothetical protein
MPNLDESIRADLDRLRDLGQPDGPTKDRMWAGVAARLGPGPDDGGFDGSGGELGGGASVSQLGFAAKVIGATLGLSGVGLLGLRLAALGFHALAPTSAAEPDVAVQDGQIEAPTITSETTATPQIDAAPATQSVGDTSVATSALAGSPKQPDSRPASTPQPQPSTPDADTLTAELALIERARAAPSADETLALLDRHRREFPSGQLDDERELLRVKALCALGQLNDARTTAAALRAGGRIPAARLVEICPALGE